MIWKPDTCECKLEYNGENIPANFVSGEFCAFHKNETDSSYVCEENTRKNRVMSELSKDPKLTKNVLLPDGTFEKRIDDDVVKWSFDANRELEIDIPNFTPLEKANAIQNLRKVSNKIKFK